jgi:hypothetical protein
MTELTTMTGKSEMLAFQAANVTGTQQIPVEFGRDLSVQSVTDSIAHRMSLPDDVSWSLRNDGSSAYLDEDLPIGDQVEPGDHLTITPKTHLAAGGLRVG